MELQAIYFVIGFLLILGVYVSLIVLVAKNLSHRIAYRTFSRIEKLLIAGILLGTGGMFQSWALEGYRFGFFLLLASTLCYILWIHVTPREATLDLTEPG